MTIMHFQRHKEGKPYLSIKQRSIFLSLSFTLSFHTQIPFQSIDHLNLKCYYFCISWTEKKCLSVQTLISNLKQMFIHCIHSKHRRFLYSTERVLFKWTLEGVQGPHIIPTGLLTDPQYLPGDVSTIFWYTCPVVIEQQSVEVL